MKDKFIVNKINKLLKLLNTKRCICYFCKYLGIKSEGDAVLITYRDYSSVIAFRCKKCINAKRWKS